MKFLNSLLLILLFQLSFSQERIKVDGISSVVGDFIILDSDIDKVLIDMESQGTFHKRYLKVSASRKINGR